MTKCYWLEPTDRVRLWLRRYVSSTKATGTGSRGYHNAMAAFGEHPVRYGEEGPNGHKYLGSFEDMGPPPDDPRWPVSCECGYVFAPEDERQVFNRSVHRRADTGAEMTIEEAPPGAMWDAWWSGEVKSADGVQLMVKLPNGSEWWVDGPSHNDGVDGPGWTRTGTIPLVTARPSIWAGKGRPGDWHGYLTDGVLAPC